MRWPIPELFNSKVTYFLRLHDLRRTLDELKRQIQEKTSEIESTRKDLSDCDGKQKLKWFE